MVAPHVTIKQIQPEHYITLPPLGRLEISRKMYTNLFPFPHFLWVCNVSVALLSISPLLLLSLFTHFARVLPYLYVAISLST